MNNLDFRGVNFCTTIGLLTATGAVTTHDTTVAIINSINGKAASRAAITAGATPTTGNTSGTAITLTASKARVVVWGLKAGVVAVEEGPIVDFDGTNYSPMPQFGAIPDNMVPFAYQVLRASSAAGTLTFGTSNWNATGFTNAIVNVAVLPEHPQTS